MKSTVAIIGGTGFETALQERFGHPALSQQMETEFGSAGVTFFLTERGPLAFLPRHGAGHSVAPHRINHRANIAALKSAGVREIFSTSAVGSLNAAYEPGDIAVIDDFIDLRGGAPTTFFDQGTVVHTDFSEPISTRLRGYLIESADPAVGRTDLPGSIIHATGVYLCVNGPRYETPAEVRCFALLGADVVGMTVAPEAILARELGLAYASLSVITDFGTGQCSSPLSHGEVVEVMATRRPILIDMLLNAANNALKCAIG